MIISVRGSSKHKNRATELISLLAAATALGKSRKSLIIQLTNNTSNNCENALVGKRLAEEIKDEEYSFNDDGIDALFRYAEMKPLSKEVFDQFVTPLVKGENYLDVAKISSKTEFVYELNMNPDLLDKLLKDAVTVYHCIYILLPHDNAELIELVTQKSDFNIVAVSQGTKEPYHKTDNTILVVNDFENASMYTVREMKKAYAVKKIYGIMHSVAYKDAYKSKNLLRFVAANVKNESQDDNYVFMQEVYRILGNYIFDTDEKETDKEEDDFVEQSLVEGSKKQKPQKSLVKVDENMVSVGTSKKKWFQKEKTIVSVDFNQ